MLEDPLEQGHVLKSKSVGSWAINFTGPLVLLLSELCALVVCCKERATGLYLLLTIAWKQTTDLRSKVLCMINQDIVLKLFADFRIFSFSNGFIYLLCLSIYLSIHLSIYICLSIYNLFIYLFVCVSACLFIYPSAQ